jgi:NADP-dependent 3-hydroxy acid dehydrogenase YdfG
MMRAFLPPMLEMNHGSIVAISAVCGHIGMPNMIPYAASKFGIRAAFKTLHFFVTY